MQCTDVAPLSVFVSGEEWERTIIVWWCWVGKDAAADVRPFRQGGIQRSTPPSASLVLRSIPCHANDPASILHSCFKVRAPPPIVVHVHPFPLPSPAVGASRHTARVRLVITSKYLDLYCRQQLKGAFAQNGRTPLWLCFAALLRTHAIQPLIRDAARPNRPAITQRQASFV